MRCGKCGSDLDSPDDPCPNCGTEQEIDPDNYFKAAMGCVAKGDLGDAVTLLEECLQMAPEHLTGRFNLGVALSMMDRCDEAIGHLYYVLTRDPDYPGIYTALGEAAFGSYLYHEEQANLKSAVMVHLFKTAIERDEDDVDAYFSLGNAYVALGLGEEALGSLRAAMALDPRSCAIHYMTAKAYKLAGRFGEARQMAARALELATPNDEFVDDIESLLAEVQA